MCVCTSLWRAIRIKVGKLALFALPLALRHSLSSFALTIMTDDETNSHYTATHAVSWTRLLDLIVCVGWGGGKGGGG